MGRDRLATRRWYGATILAITIAANLCACNQPERPPLGGSSVHLGAFPHRLNAGNDGTSYEPCSEANRSSVERLGWRWITRHDAALADRQTARGCAWDDNSAATRWGLAQTVGNSPSLAAFKRANHIFDWQPDQSIDGRPVGVYLMGSTTCVTRVQSRKAGVSTNVDFNRLPAPPASEICARAIAFTRATIGRMPE